MVRSRSSFDLAGAIATAASLSSAPPEQTPGSVYRGMALVSFGPTATGPESVMPEAPPEPPASEPSAIDEVRRPPRLPDLSAVLSPTERCERIIAWIVEAVGAQDVFITDASGLPVAGVITDAEARLAASGVVAAAVSHLAASIPGRRSPLFELHVGEGPFFQLIGLEVDETVYLVGLMRETPLTYRQAHAVRLACGHALSEPGSRGAA